MNLCRSCNTQKTNLLNLFINDFDEDDEPTLAAKFQTCTSLQVDFGDELPQKICYSCAKALESAYKFVKLCRKSDKEFRSSLAKKKQSKEIGKSESAIVSKTKTDSHNEDEELDADFLDENDETEVFTVVQQKQEQQLRKELDAGTGAGDDDHSNLSAKSQKDEKQEFASDNEFHVEYLIEDEISNERQYNVSSSNLNRNQIPENSNSSDLKFTCQLCQKRFFTPEALILHKKIHHLTTKQLNQKSRQQIQIKQAYIDECKTCCKIFENSTDYREHILKEHAYKCKICEKQLNNQYEYKIHKKECEIKFGPFLCKVCGCVEFSKHTDWLRHNLTHENTIFICNEDFCMKNFNSEAKLYEHLRVTHGIKRLQK